MTTKQKKAIRYHFEIIYKDGSLKHAFITEAEAMERAHKAERFVKSIRFFEVPRYAEQDKRLIPKFY